MVPLQEMAAGLFVIPVAQYGIILTDLYSPKNIDSGYLLNKQGKVVFFFGLRPKKTPPHPPY